MKGDTSRKILKKPVVWENLYFYRKSDAIYQLTVAFCKRYLPAYGDRTVDQMVQAARSGKQNIVEGSEDGMTSSETEIRLVNVARGSLQELRVDYMDYLHARHLSLWSSDSERQQRLRQFCRTHNDFCDYEPLLDKMDDEEMANLVLTLCHQTDKMMCAYLEKLERQFVEEGGIKERMYAARTSFRQDQDNRLRFLETENQQLKKKISELEKIIEDLRRR